MVTVTNSRRKPETAGSAKPRAPRYFRPKAKVPFVGQLAYEFGRSKPHVYLVLSGKRPDASPALIRALRRRQKELLAQAENESLVTFMKRQARRSRKARAA